MFKRKCLSKGLYQGVVGLQVPIRARKVAKAMQADPFLSFHQRASAKQAMARKEEV